MAVATEIEMKKTDVCMDLLDGWMVGWLVTIVVFEFFLTSNEIQYKTSLNR